MIPARETVLAAAGHTDKALNKAEADGVPWQYVLAVMIEQADVFVGVDSDDKFHLIKGWDFLEDMARNPTGKPVLIGAVFFSIPEALDAYRELYGDGRPDASRRPVLGWLQ